VDKLAKVYLKDGSEKWTLIYIEIQWYNKRNFPEGCFWILDKYRQDIMAVAIFTDRNINYLPDKYEKKVYQTNIILVSGI